MKYFFKLLILVVLLTLPNYGQIIKYESFDDIEWELPKGWTSSEYNGFSGVVWNWSSYGYDAYAAPHNDSPGMVEYSAWYAETGNGAILVTPNIDMSMRGSGEATVSVWFYRHSTYTEPDAIGSFLRVYISTTSDPADGTQLSLTNDNTIDKLNTHLDSVPAVSSTGWYCYTFSIPASYNSTNNHIIFLTESDWYNSIYIDDVSYMTYPPPMAYSSSTTNQVTNSPVAVNSQNNQIIAFEINTTGETAPILLNQLVCSTNGSTNYRDISRAKLYFTGNSDVFSADVQIGSTINNPGNQFIFNGNQTLLPGKNYFWIVYDVAPNATIEDVVDAECTSFLIGAQRYYPTVSAPAGNREIQTPRNGTYQVGTGYYYANLNEAFTALNILGLNADVHLQIMTDIVEPQPAQLDEPAEYNGSGFRIYIEPYDGPKTISCSVPYSSVIKINGSKRITIDGGNAKNLTFSNGIHSGDMGIELLSRGSDAGCRDITIRNCNFEIANYIIKIDGEGHNNILIDNNIMNCNDAYGYYSYGVSCSWGSVVNNLIISNNTITGTGDGDGIGNSGTLTDLIIRDNTIKKFSFGISLSYILNNPLIINNIIGSDNPDKYINQRGIHILTSSSGGTIKGNTVYNVVSENEYEVVGISASYCSDYVISDNIVYGIKCTNSESYGVYGIEIKNNINTIVVNNSVSDISRAVYYGSEDFHQYGMYDIEGSGNKYYYNTVNMNGTLIENPAAVSEFTAAMRIENSYDLDVRNNIFINNTQKTDNISLKNYAVYAGAGSSLFSMDYNDYYTPGTDGVLAYWGEDVATLEALRTLTNQNYNSVNRDVTFIGGHNLHLDGISTIDQTLYCAPISDVTTDIDGEERKSTNTNNMGADNISAIFELTPDINDPSEFYCVDYSIYNDLSFSFNARIAGFEDGIARNLVQPELTFNWYKNNELIENQTTNTFYINPVQTSDEGNYYGKASFGGLEITTSTKYVKVEAPIVILQDLPNMLYVCRDAGSVELEITASGTINNYKWYKKDFNSPQDWKLLPETGNKLTIEFADPTFITGDIALYKADIYGPGNCGSDMLSSNLLNLRVIEPMSGTSVSFIDLTAPSKTADNVCYNDKIQITVNTLGRVFDYSWQKFENNNWVDITNNYTAKLETLVLENVTPNTNGQYRCVVEGSSYCKNSQIISDVTDITVWSPFAIVDQPETNTLLCQDEDLMLWVVTEGEILNYQWQRDGVDLDLNLYPTANTPILMINDFTHELSGNFRCVITAKDCRGTEQYKTNNSMVYVLRETEIVTEPYSTGVELGKTATLEVKAHTEGAPYEFISSVQWYRGNQALEDNEFISGSKSSILTIRNVKDSDMGDDYKVIVNGHCSSDTASGFGIMAPGVEILNMSGQTFPCLGQTILLYVIAEPKNGATNLRYQWYRNGNEKLTEGTKYQGVTTSRLNITNAELSDAGNDYFVRIYIEPGNNFYVDVNQTSVVVRVKPEITNDIPSNLTIQTGKELKLNFDVDGTVPFTYQWFKDGVSIPNSPSFTYRISEVKESDAGVYYCVVSNDCGRDTTVKCTVSVTNFVGVNDELVNGWGLSNKPNPFNNETIVNFTAPKATNAKITLSDATGREIATIFNQYVEAGIYNINVNASELNLTSGVYYYTLTADGFTKTQKMVIVK